MNAYYKAKGHTDDIYIVGEVLSGSDEVAPYYQGLPALFEFDFWYKLDWAIANSTGCYFAKDILSFQQKYARYRTDYIEATKLSNHDEDRTASNWENQRQSVNLRLSYYSPHRVSPIFIMGKNWESTERKKRRMNMYVVRCCGEIITLLPIQIRSMLLWLRT